MVYKRSLWVPERLGVGVYRPSDVNRYKRYLDRFRCAVAFGSSSNIAGATGSSATSASWAISGTNLVIIVYISINSLTATISSVTWSLGSGTSVSVKEVISGTTRTAIWAIPAPTSGTGTYTVSFSASVPHQIGANYFTGADQTTPCPAGDAASASGITPNPLTVSPTNLTANDARVGVGAQTVGGDDPRISLTETKYENATSVNMSAGYSLGTGTVSCTWSIAATEDTLVGARVQVPTGGASITYPQLEHANSRGSFRGINLGVR